MGEDPPKPDVSESTTSSWGVLPAVEAYAGGCGLVQATTNP